ncbi:NAD(P)-dependent oxidoreductase [Halosolutus halophilus]|uniref:NAD(P)-dependent oxidoreductase n=1 Tax=Halosolutus halophilus TaxID=1552990 RepID=UPI0022351E8D|nr:SDR family oxidoreductase [Halosolutus halophilus]
MRLALFGATGGTGRRLTAQAIAAGHEIRALARSPAKLPTGDRITTIEGNVLDPEPVARTIEETDAVVCLLGRTPNNPRDVLSRGTGHVIGAMDERAVDRLVVLTSMGLGSSVRTVPWYVRIANVTVLQGLMADKARQEELVMQSDLDWTIVRPGGLTDGPRTGEYIHAVDVDARARPISRADVAEFLLQVLERDSYIRGAPIVTTQQDVDVGFLWDQTTAIVRRLCRSRQLSTIRPDIVQRIRRP